MTKAGVVFRVAVCCALMGFIGSGHAQSYPAKPVRFIVPFSPGSGSDTIARIIANGFPEALGQQVLVDNRAGAAGHRC